MQLNRENSFVQVFDRVCHDLGVLSSLESGESVCVETSGKASRLIKAGGLASRVGNIFSRKLIDASASGVTNQVLTDLQQMDQMKAFLTPDNKEKYQKLIEKTLGALKVVAKAYSQPTDITQIEFIKDELERILGMEKQMNPSSLIACDLTLFASNAKVLPRVFVTALEKLRAAPDVPDTSELDDTQRATISSVNQPGGLLSSRDIMQVLEFFESKGLSFTKNVQFLLTPIDASSIEQVTKKSTIAPVVIPIVVNGWIDHITVAIIQNNKLYFYDSQAVDSHKRDIGEGKTLHDLLQKIKDVYGLEAIVENKKVHQEDVHNCGAYVLHYVCQLVAEKKPPEWVHEQNIPLEFITIFRHTVAASLPDFFRKINDDLTRPLSSELTQKEIEKREAEKVRLMAEFESDDTSSSAASSDAEVSATQDRDILSGDEISDEFK